MEIESAFPDMVGKLTHEISREIENIKGTTGERDSGSKDSMSLLENRLDEIESTVSGLAKSYKLINDLVAEMNISLFKIMNSDQQTSQLEQQEPETVEVRAEVSLLPRPKRHHKKLQFWLTKKSLLPRPKRHHKKLQFWLMKKSLQRMCPLLPKRTVVAIVRKKKEKEMNELAIQLL